MFVIRQPTHFLSYYLDRNLAFDSQLRYAARWATRREAEKILESESARIRRGGLQPLMPLEIVRVEQ